MAPTLSVESKDHLDGLVKNSDKLVVCCFPRPVGQHDHSSSVSFNELAQRLDSVTSCRVDVIAHPQLRTVVAQLLSEEEQRDGDQLGWVFFRSGGKVLTVPGSTPWPKIARLIGLLEGSPDTFDQLARQEHFEPSRSRSTTTRAADKATGPAIQRSDQAVEAGAAVRSHTAGSGSGVETGAAGDAARDESVFETSPALVFVAGDRSQVGKSSTCLALLGSLLTQGYETSDLAYIKPATQCEKPQLVTEWCNRRGIACQGIGPVVFYKGFTREFLKGGAGTSEDLIQEIREAVSNISSGKKIVVVDGVGYPAVGSICGVSNGEVAAALGAPVLLVGKSGVGDAVDSFNLNACFFEARGVRVLGGVFNRIPTSGYYSLERCREAVTSYFSQARPGMIPYGFVPEIASLNPQNAAASGATPAAAPASSRGTASDAGGAAPAGGQGSSDRTARDSDRAGHTPLPVTPVESDEELAAFVKTAGRDRLVLIDFWADWCKNCKAIAPFVRTLPSSSGGGVAVATVNVDEAAEVAEERGVISLPHFIMLEDGAQVDQYTGSSETELLEKIHRRGRPAAAAAAARTGGGTTGEGSGRATATAAADDRGRLEGAEALIEAFHSNVDVPRLLRDIKDHARPVPTSKSFRTGTSSIAAATATKVDTARGAAAAEGQEMKNASVGEGDVAQRTSRAAAKSREEIEAEAAGQGASAG